MATPPEDLTGPNKFIPDLDINNPPGTDQSRRFGDDHMRGIKNVLNNCFALVNGAVAATDVELSYVAGVTSPIQTQIDNISAGATFSFWVTGQRADGFVYLNCQAADGFIANTVRAFDIMVTNAAAGDRNGMVKMAVSINDGAFGAPGDAFWINSFGAGGLSDNWKSWANQPDQTKVTFRFWAPSVATPNDTNYFFQFDMRTNT